MRMCVCVVLCVSERGGWEHVAALLMVAAA